MVNLKIIDSWYIDSFGNGGQIWGSPYSPFWMNFRSFSESVRGDFNGLLGNYQRLWNGTYLIWYVYRKWRITKKKLILDFELHINDDKDQDDKERKGKGMCSAPGVSRRANQSQTSALPPSGTAPPIICQRFVAQNTIWLMPKIPHTQPYEDKSPLSERFWQRLCIVVWYVAL